MNNDERDNMLIEIHSDMKVVADKVNNHDNTLYGNGQPGLVNDMTIIKERQDQCPARRAATFSGKRLGVAYVMMIIGIIAIIVSIIKTWL